MKRIRYVFKDGLFIPVSNTWISRMIRWGAKRPYKDPTT